MSLVSLEYTSLLAFAFVTVVPVYVVPLVSLVSVGGF